MPSVWSLIPFSSKKKGHHGSKFKEFQNYDAQRFPPYSNITQNLTHPQYYQQQQPQQNHVVQHTNPYHNHYQQVTSPPTAFSPRHQHQSQFQQQNTLVQSPQLISNPAVTNALNQCHCQHCTPPNQVGYGHGNQANTGQVMSPPQTIISPPVAPPQIQMMNSQVPLQPQTTLPVHSMVSPHQPPHMQHQQSVPLMHHDHQLVEQQCMQTPHQQHQQPHQHHQQIGSPVNDIANQYANQVSDYTSQQGTVQCTCHHCPSHQPLRQIVPTTQQYHQSQVPTHMNESLQQQFSQNTMNLAHMNQHMDMNHTNNACQHQIIGAQLPHNQMIQQPCGAQYGNTAKSKICSPQEQNQNTSVLMSSSTPRIQHQELSNQQQQQQGQCQQQYSNTDAMGVSQFHYHTIQPNQYQQQKQQLSQQQHHQRIQSLHHQVSRSPNQLNENQIAHVIESATRSYPQVDSRVHEFSRYANVRSIMSEHVYCNQKPELILPDYESPPSYDTFIANKDTYIIGLRNHHMTHHSESLVSHKTKDSSYENLRRFSPYGNFDGNRQEPGLTT